MSSSVLERLRSHHEDIESYEQAMIALLSTRAKTHREQVLLSHRVDRLLNNVVDLSNECLELYADSDGMLKEEVNTIRGPQVFTSFYDRLKEIREYHRKFPDLEAPPSEPDMKFDMIPNAQFSGEEMYGKYLDLHSCYQEFCNLPQLSSMRNALNDDDLDNSRPVDYISYLSIFNRFDLIPQSQKIKPVRQHIKHVADYLTDFYRRTNPLADLDDALKEVEETFAKDWSSQKVNGWTVASNAEDAGGINLQNFTSAQDLERLGLDALRVGLAARGLKTGGSLKERAQRLFSIKGMARHQIPKRIRAKNFEAEDSPENPTKSDGHSNGNATTKNIVDAGNSSRNLSDREVALLEYIINKLCEILHDTVEATIAQMQKKQTRTREELDAEMQEDEEGALADIDLMEEDDDDDDVPFYNPKNLPLGWDGKPIPYWLYKLHGLGIEYKCEICGNYSYWGRRAFDRHFQEWRHAHGMRCLKIPNTKHFHDITLIEDAYALYARIKDQLDQELFKGELEEEFEDTEGNVLNKKTYEDLARQGLL